MHLTIRRSYSKDGQHVVIAGLMYNIDWLVAILTFTRYRTNFYEMYLFEWANTDTDI
jgi:hypothetical protein